ncbi:MAG: ABC transporter ATP-binding protein [Micrococcaceae bacterium]
MTRLQAKNLSLGYGEKLVVDTVSIDFHDGKINMLIGANASGKSTLLSGLIHANKPMSGEVFLDGKELGTISGKERAQILGMLPQHPQAPEGITVWDLVARGRFPHQKWYQQFSETDEKVVNEALEKTDTLKIAKRPLQELSGGQQQRVWVAMALAQEADILLLDEPTSFLDIKHQLDILNVVKELNEKHGITVIMVIHELNFALRFADHVIVMRDGKVYNQGTAVEVATPEMLKDVFYLEAKVIKDPIRGTPMVVPF